MKFLISTLVLVSILTSFTAHSSEIKYCSFIKGSINSTTGQIAVTYNPRILPMINRIEIDQTTNDIFITSITDINVNLMGTANCDSSKMRDGFNCYAVEVQAPRKRFYAYIGKTDFKKVAFVQYSSLPNNVYQQDDYSCNQ